ncbi:response regulator [Ruegeria marina]|uniref:Two-component response regulator, PleD family, consists of two REC domains and a diguanylate cyclase (GGDEF) domain n=1 Tax=Ruegeria marina TaxID=639004 RepID=A0A1G6VPJ0_9RHOB|nr:response regulator [Ruegeria marina]SDD54775.1 Two-component response regulator, PleD family, consists of two REC domains and a diguanylate cyclase (GGDEF) domain [Ruegeria marina]
MIDLPPPDTTAEASVLIVDDSRVSGRKLGKAVTALGHRTQLVTGGAEALAILRETTFDIVLLDIVMPEVDGYQVLSVMKADAALRDIPVIVISALDEEIDSVARAIELGAEDFLPKNFEPAILKARMNASLARKRFRDRELAYFRDIDTLTRAAQVIEGGAFRPTELAIADVAARNDPLGGLAKVFRSLAEEIYDRERRADLTVRTLRGTLLVLAAGSIFGIAPALGRLASARDVPPLGLVFWSAVVASAVCLSASVLRRGLPRLKLRDFGFLALWAVLLGSLYQLLTVVIAAHVEATMIALIGSSRGFMVFLLAALLALERPSLRRFFGLGVGFAGIAVVLLMQGAGGEGELLWQISALVLPFLLSLHTLLMSWRPRHIDAGATVGLMMALSALFLLPFAAAQDALFLPSASFGQREIIVLALGVSTAAALVLALELVATAGPVFASQMAYSQTLAGIAWGMLLLGERLSPLAWGSLVLVIVGFWLVEPKRAGDDFRITLRMRGRQ